MVFRSSRVHLALQLGAGSVAVHELRYRLGYGHGERTLADHGHAYLTVLTPLLGLTLALAIGHFAWAVCTRRPESVGGGRIAVRTLAPALLAVHIGQELLEGLLAFGQGLDATAFIGAGEWIVLPLCVAVAAVLASLTGGARRLARAVLERGGGRSRSQPPAPGRFLATVAATPRASLARHGAERAPPLLAS